SDSLSDNLANANIPDAGQNHWQAALAFYQQAITTAPSLLNRVEAQLNQLRLLIQLPASGQGTPAAPEFVSSTQSLIVEIEQTLPQLPAGRRAIYAQINAAQSFMQLTQQLTQQVHGGDQEHSQNHHQRQAISPDPGAIASLLERAITQAEELQDERAIAYSLGTLGTWREIQQDWTSAKTLTRRALQKAQVIHADDIVYQWQWQMGRIIQAETDDGVEPHRIKQNPIKQHHVKQHPDAAENPEILLNTPAAAAAIDYYSEAVHTLNVLRTNLVALNPDVQFSFREQVEPVYRELVGLLLRGTHPPQSQLHQARNVLESLQLAELDNFFRDTCARPQAVSLETVDPTAAVMYPILLTDTRSGQIRQRLEVILQLPSGIATPSDDALQDTNAIANSVHNSDEARLLHIRQWVDDDINQVGLQLQNSLKVLRTPTNRIKGQSQQLYDWMIRPFESELDRWTDREHSPIKTLVFVLDGPLRNLPMAVLYDGVQYLVERYAIAVTPGLQLLAPQPLPRQALNILLGGAENAPSFGLVGLGPLENVGRELDEISNTIPSHKTLKDQRFLQQNIQQNFEITPFNIVHLATHGNFSSDPEQTFILDWHGAITAQNIDRMLSVADPQRAVENPLELLVLSACETAAGDRRAALGLAGIAIRAGARSTLATLWQVNDASTTEFMVRFYQELTNPDVTKADALRNVQLSFLSDNSRTRHNRPNRWAAFTLVGNWL
ncbi:MAG: CHAT domain-containing protein, partial [Cyanothece sp. SIO2G6]|nr:CHAT domain-containing protein [Cyanothece sp. SIO2G6]